MARGQRCGAAPQVCWRSVNAAGLAARALLDEGFVTPSGLTTDGAQLFLLESLRLKRLGLAAADARGWVGSVGFVSPSGGVAGCASSARGTDAPGWCLGGEPAAPECVSSAALNGEGCGVAIDDTFVYAFDGGVRLVRFELATGSYRGWTGPIGTVVPTGGDPGCTTASVGITTPGWCLGGNSEGGAADGQYHGCGLPRRQSSRKENARSAPL